MSEGSGCSKAFCGGSGSVQVYFDKCAATDSAEQTRKQIEHRHAPGVFTRQGGRCPRNNRRFIDSAGMSLGPFAFDFASRIASCEPDSIRHSETFHFGRGAVRKRVELVTIGGNPDGSGYTVAVAAKRDQTDIWLVRQLLKRGLRHSSGLSEVPGSAPPSHSVVSLVC